MSDRVNRLKFKISKETYGQIANQIKILIECGYNCFITKGFSQEDIIVLEFAEADPECTNPLIYQPC